MKRLLPLKNKIRKGKQEQSPFKTRKDPTVKLSKKLLEINLILSASKNFTFGVGANWIKINETRHPLIIYGIYILLLLKTSSSQHVVSKLQQIFHTATTLKKSIPSKSIPSFLKTNTKKLMNSILYVSKSDKKLEDKIQKFIEIINANVKFHSMVFELLNQLYLEGNSSQFESIQEDFKVKLQWKEFKRKISLDNKYICQFQITENGESQIKFQEIQVKFEQQRLFKVFKKSTINSTGFLEGSIDEEQQEQRMSIIDELTINLDCLNRSNSLKYCFSQESVSTHKNNTCLCSKKTAEELNLAIQSQYSFEIKVDKPLAKVKSHKQINFFYEDPLIFKNKLSQTKIKYN